MNFQSEINRLKGKVDQLQRCKVSCGSVPNLKIIEKTKAEFLQLVTDSELVYPATYKITDIENGLYINSLSVNEFSTISSLQAYVPSYINSGIYKGQYHVEIGAINDGEIYTWGEWNWENTSGGAITPDTPDENTIDSGAGFTQLSKSTDNHYTLNTYNATIDEFLNLRVVRNYNNNNVDVYVASIMSGYSDGLIIAGISHPQTYANTKVITVNCVFADDTEYTHGNTCFSGLAYIKNVYFTSQAGIRNCFFNNNSYVNNAIQRSSGSLIIYNCDLGRNGCYIENVITESTGGIDISSVKLDFQSYISGLTNSGSAGLDINDGSIQHLSSITNFNYSGSSGYGWSGFDIHEVVFSNYTATTSNDLSNQILHIEKTNIDSLTDVNLDTLNIIGGKGWFTVEYDFGAAPLTAGNSLLLNFIPNGARLTNCTIIPDVLSGGAGATLQVGLEVDDVSYGLAATALGAITNTVVNTVSNQATANRSIQLTAGVNDITGGTITVKVEFVI